jgi:hypothetical protein
MQVLRRISGWIFAYDCLLFLGAFALFHLSPSFGRTSSTVLRPSLLVTTIGINILFLAAAAILGMAWWTVWKQKVSSKGWAIAASLVNLLQWTTFIYCAPHYSWYCSHWHFIWTHSVIGIAGLIAFLPRRTQCSESSDGATGPDDRLLRIVQVNFVVAALLCAWGVSYVPHRGSGSTMTLSQWFWVLAALGSCAAVFWCNTNLPAPKIIIHYTRREKRNSFVGG